MFDINAIKDYPRLCDLFVKAEYQFLELKMCNRVGWWRLNLVPVLESEQVFFSGPRPEDDLQHTAHCAYLGLLLETHFGAYLPNVDFHELIRALLIHEVCETITGDVSAAEADQEKRRQKKLEDQGLTEIYIKTCFPRESQEQLFAQNRIFNNVNGEHTAYNTAGALDSFSFLFAIAWAEQSPRVNLEDKMSFNIEQISRNKFDRDNIKCAGTTFALDAVYSGLLKSWVDYYYYPLLIALSEAHYRSVEREVPKSLRALYPYHIE